MIYPVKLRASVITLVRAKVGAKPKSCHSEGKQKWQVQWACKGGGVKQSHSIEKKSIFKEPRVSADNKPIRALCHKKRNW